MTVRTVPFVTCEKVLIGELIAEFTYVLIMSKDSPLKDLKTITFDDINNYTEIAHADPYVPSLPLSEVKKRRTARA